MSLERHASARDGCKCPGCKCGQALQRTDPPDRHGQALQHGTWTDRLEDGYGRDGHGQALVCGHWDGHKTTQVGCALDRHQDPGTLDKGHWTGTGTGTKRGKLGIACNVPRTGTKQLTP